MVWAHFKNKCGQNPKKDLHMTTEGKHLRGRLWSRWDYKGDGGWLWDDPHKYGNAEGGRGGEEGRQQLSMVYINHIHKEMYLLLSGWRDRTRKNATCRSTVGNTQSHNVSACPDCVVPVPRTQAMDTETLYSKVKKPYQGKEKHVHHNKVSQTTMQHNTKYLPQNLGLTIWEHGTERKRYYTLLLL